MDAISTASPHAVGTPEHQRSTLRHRRPGTEDTLEPGTAASQNNRCGAAPVAAAPAGPGLFRRMFWSSKTPAPASPPETATQAAARARTRRDAPPPSLLSRMTGKVVGGAYWTYRMLLNGLRFFAPIAQQINSLLATLKNTPVGNWLAKHMNVVALGLTSTIVGMATVLGVHWAVATALAAGAVVIGIGVAYLTYRLGAHCLASYRGDTRKGSFSDALKAVRMLQKAGIVRGEVLTRDVDVDDIHDWKMDGNEGKKLKKIVSSINRQRRQSDAFIALSATALAKALVPDPHSGGRLLNMGKEKHQTHAAFKLFDAGMLHDAVAMLSNLNPDVLFLKDALAQVGTHKQITAFFDAHPGQNIPAMDLRRAKLAMEAGMNVRREVVPYLANDVRLTPAQGIARLELICKIRTEEVGGGLDLPKIGKLLEELENLGQPGPSGTAEPSPEWDRATQSAWWRLRGDILISANNDFVAAATSYQTAIEQDTDGASPRLRLSHANALLGGKAFTDAIQDQLHSAGPRLPGATLRTVGARCREAFALENNRSRPRAALLADACVGMALAPAAQESADMWLRKAQAFAPESRTILQALRAVLPSGSVAHVLYGNVRTS